VGFYDLESLERLPVLSEPGAADELLLTTVHVP
jgi:hypothetical protein